MASGAGGVKTKGPEGAHPPGPCLRLSALPRVRVAPSVGRGARPPQKTKGPGAGPPPAKVGTRSRAPRSGPRVRRLQPHTTSGRGCQEDAARQHPLTDEGPGDWGPTPSPGPFLRGAPRCELEHLRASSPLPLPRHPRVGVCRPGQEGQGRSGGSWTRTSGLQGGCQPMVAPRRSDQLSYPTASKGGIRGGGSASTDAGKTKGPAGATPPSPSLSPGRI